MVADQDFVASWVDDFDTLNRKFFFNPGRMAVLCVDDILRSSTVSRLCGCEDKNKAESKTKT